MGEAQHDVDSGRGAISKIQQAAANRARGSEVSKKKRKVAKAAWYWKLGPLGPSRSLEYSALFVTSSPFKLIVTKQASIFCREILTKKLLHRETDH